MAGATRNPDSAWVTQQARNVAGTLDEQGTSPRFLIHDRDTKFSGSFDAVFKADGTRIMCTPIRAPNANAFAERWVGTVRAECLDWTLIQGRRHLERVLRTYVQHFNHHRPHRGLNLKAPAGPDPPRRPALPGQVRRRSAIGGLTNEYYAARSSFRTRRVRRSNPLAPTGQPWNPSWSPSGARIWVLRSDFAGARLTPSELQGSAIGRRRDAGTRRRLL